MTALSINESLFYIPFDHTGVISVCNNKYGNELACIVSDISDDRTSLNIGDSVCMQMDFADRWVLVKKSAQGHRHNILSFSLKHTG